MRGGGRAAGDAECFICKDSIEGKGIASCACHGGMGLAHVACLAWRAEVSVTEKEEWNTGERIMKSSASIAVKSSVRWAGWKTYIPERNRLRFIMALRLALYANGRYAEALPVFEAQFGFASAPLAACRSHHPLHSN